LSDKRFPARQTASRDPQPPLAALIDNEASAMTTHLRSTPASTIEVACRTIAADDYRAVTKMQAEHDFFCSQCAIATGAIRFFVTDNDVRP
jgi:hypothetical protein